jgi:hypothetical protein
MDQHDVGTLQFLLRKVAEGRITPIEANIQLRENPHETFNGGISQAILVLS